MTVTALLVARNQAETIGRAVRSVAAVAWETVVVETGSIDDTAAVASAAGARVVPHTWADDFSAAFEAGRNAARGAWVLQLNPDEELEPLTAAAVAAATADDAVLAYRLPVFRQLAANRPDLGSASPQLRLYRNDAGLRYVGRANPRFDPSAEVLAVTQRRRIADCPATIRRHSYLTGPTPEKLRFAARLLEADLADRPGQLDKRIELGLAWHRLGDPRAETLLTECAEEMRRCEGPIPPTPAAGPLLEFLLQQADGAFGSDGATAERSALRWFPDTPPVVWAVAARRFRAGEFAAAAEQLERLLFMGRTGRFDVADGFDPEIVGPAALMNLGVCRLRLGDGVAADGCFSLLAADPKYGTDARSLFGRTTGGA